jgi:N utilization substance protein A
VLVREDQLSLAIGRKGQNVRLASKLCGWDIEIMTNDELEQQIDRAVGGFMQIEGMTEELAQRLVEQGYLSYDDLSVIEPDALMEMGSMTEEQVDTIVNQAETLAEQAERAADDERRRKKQEDASAAAIAAAGGPPAAPAVEAAAASPAAEAPAVEAAAGVEPPAEIPPLPVAPGMAPAMPSGPADRATEEASEAVDATAEAASEEKAG